MYYFGTQQNSTTIELLEYEFPVITRTHAPSTIAQNQLDELILASTENYILWEVPFKNFIQDL